VHPAAAGLHFERAESEMEHSPGIGWWSILTKRNTIGDPARR